MPKLYLIATYLTFFLTGNVGAQAPLNSSLEPKQLFLKMVKAADTESYRGSLAFERAGQLATYWIENQTEAADAQSLRPLNRVRPELNHSVLCHEDRSETLVDIDLLSTLYNFYRPGDGLVAGRPVTELLLLPVDGYRYGYGFSVDQATFLPLRTVILTPQREPIERYEFLDIEFLLPEKLSPGGNCSKPQETPSQWSITGMPEGFRIDSSIFTAAQRKSALVLSDGLATVSVSIEQVATANFPPVTTRLGATTVLLNYLYLDQKVYLATLVGEVPLQSLELIAAGLHPNPTN